MTFIALPILPSEPIDPWELINLRELWFLTILIATLSFAGYVAVRLLGQRAGLALGAVAGSVVSSTMTVAELAGRVRQGTLNAPDAAAAACLTTLIMLVRIILLVAFFAPHLLAEILPVLGAGAAAGAAGALYLFRPRPGLTREPLLPNLKSPLDLRSVASLALLIGGLNVCIALFTRWAGDIAAAPSRTQRPRRRGRRNPQCDPHAAAAARLCCRGNPDCRPCQHAEQIRSRLRGRQRSVRDLFHRRFPGSDLHGRSRVHLGRQMRPQRADQSAAVCPACSDSGAHQLGRTSMGAPDRRW